MSNLPDSIEVDIAQARIRDAVRAFSRAPTEANQHRVATAMKLWRQLNTSRAAGPSRSVADIRHPEMSA